MAIRHIGFLELNRISTELCQIQRSSEPEEPGGTRGLQTGGSTSISHITNSLIWDGKIVEIITSNLERDLKRYESFHNASPHQTSPSYSMTYAHLSPPGSQSRSERKLQKPTYTYTPDCSPMRLNEFPC